jgi:glycosidase
MHAGARFTRHSSASLARVILTHQELGLEEVIDLNDDVRQDPAFTRQTLQQRRSDDVHLGRDGCRVPLPWKPSGPSLGFAPDGCRSAWLPQPQHWARLSVATQEAQDDSMLQRVRHAIRVRRTSAPLLEGAFAWADQPQRAAESPAASENSPFPVFSPLDDGLMMATSLGTALADAAASAWLGLKRLLHVADPNVLVFQRRHVSAGCVVCVFNMGDADAPRPQGQVLLFLHARVSAHLRC